MRKVLLAASWVLALGCGEDERPPAALAAQDMGAEMRPGLAPAEVVQSALGGECVRDDNCAQGLFCDQRRPGGYCTRLCESAAQCEPGQRCSSPGEELPSSCLVGCEQQPCRQGYTCVRDERGASTCVAPLLPSRVDRFEDMLKVLGADCEPRQRRREERGWRWSWDFVVGPQHKSLLVVPFVERGLVSAAQLVTPRLALDIQREYIHHNQRAQDSSPRTGWWTGFGTYGRVSFDWPVLVPYASKFAGAVVPGLYTFEAIAEHPPCLLVLKSFGGARLDLNIYLVGLRGLDASSAKEDEAMRAALKQLDEIYAPVGLKIGEVRYFDVAPAVSTRYAILRSAEDARRLMAHGRAHEPTLSAHLSLDVFLVRDILIDGGLTVGLSGGVPGAAGMHGNVNNGIIVQANTLGAAHDKTAQVIAHEIGHFLGLRHTTELARGASERDELRFADLGLSDPLDDTPECRAPLMMERECPDSDNLMFPMVFMTQDSIPSLSAEQGMVLRASPLTY